MNRFYSLLLMSGVAIAANAQHVNGTLQQAEESLPAPSLSLLVVSGHEFVNAMNAGTEFTATGKYYENEVSYVVTTDEADTNEITVEKNYDEESGLLTLTLKQEGHANGVYTIKFEGNAKEAVYNIPNSDFENWTEEGKLAETWNSFDTASGAWSSFATMSPMPQMIDGYKGKGVRIVSKDLWVAYANGNLTTGHINMGDVNPAAASNFNYSDRTDVNGNLPFAGRPDAFEVYARFAPGTKSASAAEDVELQGRVQLVLHGDAAFHDPFVADQENDKIAVASVLVPETSEWTKFTGEFNYTNESYDGNMFMLASATTNPVPGASKDDQFDIDNLKLIYYHTLKAITLKGEPIEGFSPEKTDYTINGSIDKLGEYLDYEKMGKGGYVDEDWDAQDDGAFVVTYTVYGDDYDVNPDSKTVYTVRFENATGIGSISADEVKNNKVYTIGGVRVSGKPAAGLYIVDGKKMIIK